MDGVLKSMALDSMRRRDFLKTGAALAGLVGGCSIGQLHAGIPRWEEPFFDMAASAVAMLTEHLRRGAKLEDKKFPMVYHEN